MKLNKRIASQDEHGRIANIIKWCKRHNQTINGFPYGDDLVGSDGIHLELLVLKVLLLRSVPMLWFKVTQSEMS